MSDFELEEKSIFLIKMLLFFSPLMEIWIIYRYKYEVWVEIMSQGALLPKNPFILTLWVFTSTTTSSIITVTTIM